MDRDRDRDRDRERERERERLERPSRPLERMDIAGTNGRGSVASRSSKDHTRGKNGFFGQLFFLRTVKESGTIRNFDLLWLNKRMNDSAIVRVNVFETPAG